MIRTSHHIYTRNLNYSENKTAEIQKIIDDHPKCREFIIDEDRATQGGRGVKSVIKLFTSSQLKFPNNSTITIYIDSLLKGILSPLQGIQLKSKNLSYILDFSKCGGLELYLTENFKILSGYRKEAKAVSKGISITINLGSHSQINASDIVELVKAPRESKAAAAKFTLCIADKLKAKDILKSCQYQTDNSLIQNFFNILSAFQKNHSNNPNEPSNNLCFQFQDEEFELHLTGIACTD